MKDSEKSLDEQVWKLLGHLDVLIEKFKYTKKETNDTKKDDTDTDDSYDEELQFVISLLFVDLRAKTIPEMIESISNGTLNFAMEPANAVRNVSESLENDLNRTSEFLRSVGQRYRDFKAYDDQVVLPLKEEVNKFREILGAGTNAKCSFNEASDSEKNKGTRRTLPMHCLRMLHRLKSDRENIGTGREALVGKKQTPISPVWK
ncbi:hypothetical protein EGW08_003950 [Elysia chlorotica]|uniref:Uncharacterized protein n=1 Tax=Elysia chlorotica TaxID=188477 RepID=A0A433U3B7_ELYCH|nr:hypothetical protein EGW08_003950 [Elysia chlorotica]